MRPNYRPHHWTHVNCILSFVPYTSLLDSALPLLVVLLFAVFYVSCVILSYVVEYSFKLSLTLSIIFPYVVRPHHYTNNEIKCTDNLNNTSPS